MQNLLRATATAGLVALLAACGGGSSSDHTASPGTDSEAPVVQGPGTPSGGSAAGSNDAGSSAGGNGSATTALPRIYIQTAGGVQVVNTDDYVDATIRVIAADGSELMNMPTAIRGRGNTTWGMPKKPYRLKLNEAATMLGMPAERDWNLLANYSDKSLVRNGLAMTLGQQVGLPYTPRSKFIEMYFNGEYQGVYQVFEHVEVGPNRVPVQKLDPDEVGGDITGGYFMEVDHRLDEDVCWFTSMNIPICSKDPEFDPDDINDPTHPSYAQYRYITSYVNSAEQAIATPGNSYLEYFDVDAMVNWYLVSELMKNNDSRINRESPDDDAFTSSVFMYKPRDGKLTFGPLWDFDIAAGNINYNFNDQSTGWYIRQSEWHRPLFEHSDFGDRVFRRWCELQRSGVISGIGAQVDRLAAELDKDAVTRNFQKWDILGRYVWPNSFVGNTHQEEVDHLKKWMNERATWMHNELVREHGACPA